MRNSVGLECDTRGKLETVREDIVGQSPVPIIHIVDAISHLGVEITSEMAPKASVDLPGQIGADTEAANVGTTGEIEGLGQIIVSAQTHERIPPVVCPCDPSIQRVFQGIGNLPANARFHRVDPGLDARPKSPTLTASLISVVSPLTIELCSAFARVKKPNGALGKPGWVKESRATHSAGCWGEITPPRSLPSDFLML